MFQEDLSEYLDLDQGFASDALVFTADGKEYLVRGILSRDYVDIDSGGIGGDISGDNPIFECAEEDVIGIAYDDILSLNGMDYRIRIIKPDGTGWMTLVLEEQD